jgi:hypothetical protein
MDATCVVTATYSASISNSTGLITIIAVADTTPPSTPGQPALGETSKDKITISWPANSEPDLDGYIIQRSKDEDGPWVNVSTVDKTTTSFTDEGLDPGTTYYYRVVAVDNASNPSSPSPFVKASTEPEEEFPLFMIIIVIVIIVVVVLLLLMLTKKKPKAEDALPPEESEVLEEPTEDVPPAEEDEMPSDTDFPEEEALEEDISPISEEPQSPEVEIEDEYGTPSDEEEPFQ